MDPNYLVLHPRQYWVGISDFVPDATVSGYPQGNEHWGEASNSSSLAIPDAPHHTSARLGVQPPTPDAPNLTHAPSHTDEPVAGPSHYPTDPSGSSEWHSSSHSEQQAHAAVPYNPYPTPPLANVDTFLAIAPQYFVKEHALGISHQQAYPTFPRSLYPTPPPIDVDTLVAPAPQNFEEHDQVYTISQQQAYVALPQGYSHSPYPTPPPVDVDTILSSAPQHFAEEGSQAYGFLQHQTYAALPEGYSHTPYPTSSIDGDFFCSTSVPGRGMEPAVPVAGPSSGLLPAPAVDDASTSSSSNSGLQCRYNFGTCTTRFESRADFEAHLLAPNDDKHKGHSLKAGRAKGKTDDYFPCQWTGCAKLLKVSSLLNHVMTHCSIRLQCHICGAACSRNDRLAAHYKTVHQQAAPGAHARRGCKPY